MRNVTGIFAFCAALTAVICSAQVMITQHPVPTSESYLSDGITTGPDGNLWFLEGNGIKVAKMSPAGTILGEFPIPSQGIYNNGSGTGSITTGPDGNLWFPEYFANKIGRITPGGVITEFPIPSSGLYGNGTFPLAITAGPDGNLWFTEYVANKIGRITPAGVITEFSVPSGGIYGASFGITTGPDGNIWFTECRCSTGASGPTSIGRITSGGTVTEFPLASGSNPFGIRAGPDGNLWFVEAGANKIGRITPVGVITEFPLPTNGSAPLYITAGPDGNLWFTESNGNNIGKMTTGGVISEFSVPTPGSRPTGIISGPNGNLWFVESGAKKIGNVVSTPSGPPLTVVSGSTLPSGTVGAFYSQSLLASGGNPPYGWSLVSGVLPAGLSLSSAGAITGMPAATGTSIFTARVTDVAGASVTQTFSITMGSAAFPLTITTVPALPQGAVGTFYTQSLGANGGVTPYSWSLVSGALPSGLSLSSSGAIAGVPTAAGTLTFTARVTDAASSSAAQTFTLTIVTSQTFTSAYRVPHINDGAGWTTRFSVINTDKVPVTFTFQFWGDGGSPLSFPILNGTPGVLTGTLAPGASFFAQSSGTSSSLQWGWAEVASSGKIGVTAILQYSTGGPRDSLGSETATQSGNSIIMPFDNTQGNVAAIAIANANPTQPLTVSMQFETDGGAQSNTSIILQPHGHQAFMVPTHNPAVAGFRGSIQFTAPSPDIVVMGFEFTPTGQFASVNTF